MHLIKDFFLLNWQEDLAQNFQLDETTQSRLSDLLKNDKEFAYNFITISLIINSKNAENILQMSTFQELLLACEKKNIGINELKEIQKQLLFFLNDLGNMDVNKQIQKRFELLRKESVIGYGKARELMSLLTLIEEKSTKEIKKEIKQSVGGQESYFKDSIISLENIIAKLKSLIEVTVQKENLAKIPQKIKSQKFSIGVTGVMNAGKSTTLNALLHQNILGTSVVPETANLTVLKYSDTPKAVVNFWNEKEWGGIEKSAQLSASLQEFVSETKNTFASSFSNYITKIGKSEEIKIEELINYTSAKHSNKKCNLVKSVELYSDLKFLANGVMIVDTPGLDDPVIQREEITKEYLSQCDLMIHLMNVNQSATAKDVEFLVDTLLYQNVSRLLVLITRIDTVSKEELSEVIEYTKKAIKEKLSLLNKERSFESIIEKLDFIPIASKVALDYRIGNEEEAKKSGYTLEQSGILAVEAYLEEVLFGSNSQKAKIILDSAIKEVLLNLDVQRTYFTKEKELLSKSSSEIESELEQYQSQLVKVQAISEKLTSQVFEIKEELIDYFQTLKNMVKNRTIQLQNLVKRRVVDDVSYEQRKNKKRPEKQRISYIIETGIKDGFIDLVREYRHGFMKKIEESFEALHREFEDLEEGSVKQEDAKEFFEKYFDLNLFVSSTTQLISDSNSFIDAFWKKDLESLDSELEKRFGLFFESVYDSFISKVTQINTELLKSFEVQILDKVEQIQNESKQKRELLQNALSNLQNSTFDKEKRLEIINNKNQTLDTLEKKLLALRGENV